MIDVFIVAKNDLANVGYRVCESLKTTGLVVKGGIQKLHQFDYPEHLSLMSLRQMQQECKNAKIVWFITGDKNLYKQLKPFITGKVVVTHPGSTYRREYKLYNDIFSKAKHIAVSTDMVALDNKAVYNGLKTFDADKLVSVYNKNEIPVIGHFPSNPDKKGTAKITRVLNALKKDYKFKIYIDTDKVPYTENIKRMQKCDIVIEQLFDEMYGVEMGILGQQAFEAAFLGNIVVSNLYKLDLYEKKYGSLPIYLCNTEKGLLTWLPFLLKMSVEERTHYQVNTRNWAVNTHSYIPMGKVLLNDIKELL